VSPLPRTSLILIQSKRSLNNEISGESIATYFPYSLTVTEDGNDVEIGLIKLQRCLGRNVLSDNKIRTYN